MKYIRLLNDKNGDIELNYIEGPKLNLDSGITDPNYSETKVVNVYSLMQEIDRLNNIINELEKDIQREINTIEDIYSQVNGIYFNMDYVLDTYEKVLNKLKELKGDDAE